MIKRPLSSLLSKQLDIIINLPTKIYISLFSARPSPTPSLSGVSVPVVDDDPVGELEVLRAPELVEHVAELVEDNHSHHLQGDIGKQKQNKNSLK